MRSVLLLAVSTLVLGGGIDIPRPPISEDPTPIEFDSDYGYDNKFDLILVSPIDVYTKTTRLVMKVSFEKELTRDANIQVYVINRDYEDGAYLGLMTVSKRADKVCFDYDNKYTLLGSINSFYFKLKSQYGTDEVNVFPYSRDYHNVQVKSKNQSEETESNIVRYQRKTGLTDYVSEEYLFYKYSDVMYQNADTPFIFTSFAFKYMSDKSFVPIINDATLVIYRMGKDYFDEIGSDLSGGYRSIRLKVTYDSDTSKVTFASAEKLYVNPITHEMCSYQKDGYVKTDYIYFPTSVKANTRFIFKYNIAEFGANRCKISAITSVIVTDKVMGDCVNSMYCLGTRESNPDTDLGERIVY